MFLTGKEAGADYARVGAPSGLRDRYPFETGRKRPPPGLHDGGVEEQVGRHRQPAADDEVLGLEDVHEARDADAQPGAEFHHHPDRVLVALTCGSDDLDAGHGPARALGRLDPERCPAAVALQAAAVRALTGTVAAHRV